MKKYSGGLGLITLILSLSFFYLGSLEGETTSSHNYFFTQSYLTQDQIVSDALDLNFDGLLQRQFGSRIVPDVSKFPVSFNGVVSLFEPKTVLNQEKYFLKDFCFFSPTDLSVKYHNLRI